MHLIGQLIFLAIAPAAFVERTAQALAFVTGWLRSGIIAMQAAAMRVLFFPCRDQRLHVGLVFGPDRAGHKHEG
ncbi:hypothetical protein JP74_02695 [Devosia sp. 17-2-E-8]|nr:hypothetical protein JP74_02695 [Devosia sp. 17-2-E-8]